MWHPHGANSPAVIRLAYTLQLIDTFYAAVLTSKHTHLPVSGSFSGLTRSHAHTGSDTAGHHFSRIISNSVWLNICITALCWLREANNRKVRVVHSWCVLEERAAAVSWFVPVPMVTYMYSLPTPIECHFLLVVFSPLIWVWWWKLPGTGLVWSFPLFPLKRAAGFAPCISILPASFWFVLKQPGLQFILSLSRIPSGGDVWGRAKAQLSSALPAQPNATPS